MSRLQLVTSLLAFTTTLPAVARSSDTLVTDINPAPPLLPWSSDPLHLAGAHGRVFFTADTEFQGREPFVSDGTAAGTHLVADVFPELLQSSNALRFAELPGGGGVLFFANDGVAGNELWTCAADGTGASRVADIRPGPSGSLGGPFTAFGGKLYFLADDGVHGRELWATQGTAATTVLFKEFVPGPGGLGGTSSPPMCVIGDVLYVAAVDGASSKAALWRTDGTAAGTQVVVSGAFSGTPDALVAYQGNVYFGATHPTLGNELWRSDGTAAGTYVVRDVHPQGSASPGGMTVVGDRLLFAATHPATQRELFRTDGTFAGTELVADIASGFPNLASTPEPLGRLGDRLVFRATTAAAGRELWVSDGTTAGTMMVSDLRPGAEGSDPGDAAVLGARLFFAADDGIAGREPWFTDGTTAGTARVADLRAGPAGSAPSLPATVAGRVLFRADDGVVGTELWASDGTAAGTHRVADLLVGPATEHAFPDQLTRVGSKLYLSAREPIEGRELYVVDGPAAGAVRVASIAPGAADANPCSFEALDERLFFFADDGQFGLEPWLSDGTAAGTTLLKDLHPGPGASVSEHSPRETFEGRVYFRATEPLLSAGLYATDGTVSGTVRVSDVAPAQTSGAMAVAGGRLFFAGGTPATGIEPCVTDGTAAGTKVVRDLRPGTESSLLDGWVFPAGDRVFFAAEDGVHGRELWVSDGTAGGTRLVVDHVPGTLGLDAVGVAAFGADAIAVLTSTSTSTVVRTDGSPAGTVVLATFPTGVTVGPDVVVAGGEAFFRVATFSVTRIWRSDGTAAGTAPLAGGTAALSSPVVLGAPGSGIRIAARAAAPGIGTELVACGGDLPHYVAKDLRAGPLGSDPESIVRVGSRVYFVADDGIHGRELHALPLSFFQDHVAETYGTGCAPSGPAPTWTVTSAPHSGATFAFEASGLSPNGTALLVLGITPTHEPLPGDCTLLVASPFLPVPLPTNASGKVPFAATVPPGFVDLAAYLQLLDANSSGALLTTPALEIVIGP